MRIRGLATWTIATAVAGATLAACSDQTATEPTATTPTMASMNHNAQAGAEKGFTDGWYDGRTVQFFYNKNFFCKEPPASAAPSDCEAGAEPEVTPRPGNIPVLYVMVPVGIEVPQSTLQCPVAGSCINHPSTIDLSRVFGAGAASVLLPPHSHIVDVKQGGWWEIEVVGVTSLDTWNQVVAGKDLSTVRRLQAAGAGITGDIPSNLFLFFSVGD
jgi:hypothetical protein